MLFVNLGILTFQINNLGEVNLMRRLKYFIVRIKTF